MNNRERFLSVMRFNAPDIVPVPSLFQQFEAETIKRWGREGLPRDVHVVQHFGFERMELVPVNMGPLPGGDLADAEDAREWQVGADRGHTEDSVQQSQHVKEIYPLAGSDAWSAWRGRLNPASPARYPRFWDDYCRARRERDYPLGVAFPGPFSALRDWIGTSALSRALRENRAWVAEMLEYLGEFGVATSARALKGVAPDFAIVRERGSYRAPLMGLDDDLARLLTACYRKWSDALAAAGVEVRLAEAPGNIAAMIPLWLEGGLNGLCFAEVSAGLDARALRAEYGKSLTIVGNVDHNALAGAHRDIADELRSKVRDLVTGGGYIPAPDRTVSSEVSLDNYEYYLETLRVL